MLFGLSEQEIEEVLQDNTWGHLGCNDGFNTYVYPVNYVYDGNFILCHSQEGTKVRVMRQNRRVCFQVEEVMSHQNWRSVMVLGVYQEVVDEEDRKRTMKAFRDRQMHLKVSEAPGAANQGKHADTPPMEGESRSVLFRIGIDKKTGQYEDD